MTTPPITPKASKRVDLALCPLDPLTMEEALFEIAILRHSSEYHYVVTPNIDHLQRLYLNPDDAFLREIYRNASLSLCDSRVLKILTPIFGVSMPAAVPGSTLTKQIFDQLLKPEDRILIIGGENAVIEILSEQYPHLDIEHINPTMGFIHRPVEVEEIISATREMDPDYLFIAVGSPQQEILASRIGQVARRGVALCVGASLLFLTGKESRAPEWVQAASCEWLYRMIKNPRRLAKRYAMNLIHLPGILHALRAKVVADAGVGVDV